MLARWQVLSNEAKRRQYDAGSRGFAELVDGFWAGLRQRMQGKRGRGGGAGSQKGVVVATGSGISLKELAEAEEADSGTKAASFLLGPAADEE